MFLKADEKCYLTQAGTVDIKDRVFQQIAYLTKPEQATEWRQVRRYRRQSTRGDSPTKRRWITWSGFPCGETKTPTWECPWKRASCSATRRRGKRNTRSTRCCSRTRCRRNGCRDKGRNRCTRRCPCTRVQRKTPYPTSRTC